MNPEQPRTGKCEAHGLQLAPDGKCALCRRASAARAEPSSDGGRGNKIVGAIALIGVVVTLFWMFRPSSGEQAAVSHGPPLKEQIAAVDEQLKELRIARRNGDLDANGLNALDRLETKRKLLVAAQTAQEGN